MELLEGVEIARARRPAPRAAPSDAFHDRRSGRSCAQRIGARETWLIHLTHEVDHATVEATLPDGIKLAYDGLVLEVD